MIIIRITFLYVQSKMGRHLINAWFIFQIYYKAVSEIWILFLERYAPSCISKPLYQGS
uniref:Uncharacterized protein n=1 Tax=Arundo donax TaxID=35708 RepID=A0A0A9F9U9_ARUDO